MQATTSSSHQVSPITCPPQEKPQVTLADVLRGGAENDRRSLQAYLHTLAAREKEKRKRKRQERKSKRSSSSKKKKRSEDDLSASSPGSTASLSSSSSLGTVDSQNNTPSGSIDLSSSMMMRGSVDLTAMRLASNEYDAMRGSLDMSAMGHAHHMRSRSVDFGALRANTAAFDAMRASLDMSAMGPGLGLGAHYSHHGSFAGYQPHLGGSASGPAYARASCDFDAMSNATGFGADISPTSSFCMEGPVFLEPAPLASFSVDEHSPQSQQPVYAQSSQPTFAQPQAQPVYSSAQSASMMMPPQAHLQHQPQQQMYAQSSTTMSQQPTTPLTDLPDFEDFVSSAFLEAFPEDAAAAAAAIDFNPAALLEQQQQQQPFSEQQQQPQQAAPVFAVPAPPQHVLQRSQSPAPVPQQHQQQLHLQYHPVGGSSPQQQPHRSCSCPDCHVTPVTPSELNSAMAQHGYVPAGLEEAAAAVVQQQPGASSGQRVVHPSFAVEEDQANDFLAQFLEWSEQRGVASPLSASLSSPSVSSPATSLYF